MDIAKLDIGGYSRVDMEDVSKLDIKRISPYLYFNNVGHYEVDK